MVRVDGRLRVVINMAIQSMYRFCLELVASIFQRKRLNSVHILILIGPRPFTRFLLVCSLHSTPKFGSISAEHNDGADAVEIVGVGEIPAEFDGDSGTIAARDETDGEGDDDIAADIDTDGLDEAEGGPEFVAEGEAPKLKVGVLDGVAPILRLAVADGEIEGETVMVGVRVAVAVAVIVIKVGST